MILNCNESANVTNNRKIDLNGMALPSQDDDTLSEDSPYEDDEVSPSYAVTYSVTYAVTYTVAYSVTYTVTYAVTYNAVCDCVCDCVCDYKLVLWNAHLFSGGYKGHHNVPVVGHGPLSL